MGREAAPARAEVFRNALKDSGEGQEMVLPIGRFASPSPLPHYLIITGVNSARRAPAAPPTAPRRIRATRPNPL